MTLPLPEFSYDGIIYQLHTQFPGDSSDGFYRFWNQPTVTYFISDSIVVEGGDHDEGDSWVVMTPDQAAKAREAFTSWNELISGINLVEASGPSGVDITFAYSSATLNDGTYASATLGDQVTLTAFEIAHEEVWMSNNATKWPQLQPGQLEEFGGYGYLTYLHEIGHSLGLSHPGSYNADQNPTYAVDAEFAQDTRQYSIMSYFGGYEEDVGWIPVGNPSYSPTNAIISPSTPMLYDMAAIQSQYGADFTTRPEDTTYGYNAFGAGWSYFDFATNTDPVFTIWDGGGYDTIDASLFLGNQRIDLRPGTYSDVLGMTDNIAIDFNFGVDPYLALIENAKGGGGADAITGNIGANRLEGNNGKDILRGGNGDDTLLGGAQDDELYGDPGSDQLSGDAGNDILDGGGSDLGLDLLTGGTGNDTIIYATGYRATTVTDFARSVAGGLDILDLNDAPVHNFTELLSKATQQGADLVFDFGGATFPPEFTDVLRLQNFQLGDLDPSFVRFTEATESPPGDFPLPLFFHPYATVTASLGDGGFIGISEDFASIFTSDFLTAQRFDVGGVPGATFLVNSTPRTPNPTLPSHVTPVRAVNLSDGRFVVAWESDDPGGGSFRCIRARIFDADGTPTGPDFLVNSTPAVVQLNGSQQFEMLDLTATPTSGFIITWLTDVTPGNTSFQSHIYRRAFDAAGQPVGLDEDTGFAGPDNPNLPGGLDDGLDFLLADGGGVLHYWQGLAPSDTSGTGGTHLFAQILGHTAVVQLDSFSFFPDPTGNRDQHLISVSQLGDGRIVFTWPTGFGFNILGNQAIILDSDLLGFTRPGTSVSEVLEGGPHNDRLYGLAGNDTLIGNAGPDLLNGGPGTDIADYDHSLQGVNVDLTRTGPQSGGHADEDILVSIENLKGSAYEDSLTGDAGVNVIHGSYGDDTIDGGDGADQLFGDRGMDVIRLRGPGIAFGGPNDDVIFVLSNGAIAHGDQGDDDIHIAADNALAFGEDGENFVSVIGAGNIVFGGDDHLSASVNGDGNTIHGGAGKDLISIAGGANNILYGGANDDPLSDLGAGSNTLVGGGGDDRLLGGAGPDTAVFSGNRADYLITGSPADLIIADQIPNRDGTDRTLTIAFLQFADGTLSTDVFQGPTVTLESDKLHLAAGETATVTFTFSEDVTGFDLGDLAVGGGSLGPITTVSAHIYQSVFTPDAGVHSASIQLASNAVTDLAGNANTGASLTLGLIIDGYITGATVFADANGNGVLDTGEASSITDDSGSFLLSGGTGPLVMVGGFDIGTLLPFEGKLSAPAGASVITPLMTLLTYLDAQGIPNAQATLLAAFGLNPATDLANLDPIAAALGGDPSGEEAFAAGAIVLDTVTLIAAALGGNDPAAFANAFDDAFAALAAIVADAGSPIDPADPAQIESLINGTLTIDGGSLDPSIVDGVAEIIAAQNGAILTAIQSHNGIDALAAITAIERVAQGVAAGALRGLGGDPSNLLSAIAAYSDHLDVAITTAASQIGDIDGPGASNAPHAVADNYSVAVNTSLVVLDPGVLANDTDADGDALTAILLAGPSHGNLTFNSEGSFTYTPNAGFSGTDTFTYNANDGLVSSNTATVSIDVGAAPPTNTAPVAVADGYSTGEDNALNVGGPGVLGNDADADGDALKVLLVSGPAHGSLTLNLDGSFLYTPAANTFGSDSFTYKPNDGTADGNPVTVSLTVTPVNDAPVATADSYSTAEGSALNVTGPGVLGNDADADGDALKALLVSGPAHGSLTLKLDGSFLYTPAADTFGSDSFSYKPNDGTADGNPVTVSLAVTPVNDAPVATADSYSVVQGSSLTVPKAGVLINDSDVENDPLTAIQSSAPAHGSLVFNADGSFTYTPNTNFSGADAFSYRSNDGQADSNVAAVNITVTAAEVERTVRGSSHGDHFTDAPGFATTYLGGNGKDIVSGLDGADRLHGGNGTDSLQGGAGNDRLFGENGEDSLDSGVGDDWLVGGRGNDQLTGGSGADTFAFDRAAGNDTVTDFELHVDHLGLIGGMTVRSAINTDVDHTGLTDVVLHLSIGTVTLLNVGPITDWHALIS